MVSVPRCDRLAADARSAPTAYDQTVGELIALMSTREGRARMVAAPRTPPYHSPAQELERLACVVYNTTSSEERIAEAARVRDGGPASARRDA
jgi:hypothetical protein